MKIRRLRDVFGAGTSGADIEALVDTGMADVLVALGTVIDDETALGRVYTLAGAQAPAAAAPDDGSDSDANAVCASIGMLESAIGAAMKPGSAATLLGIEYMATARRLLFQLRKGLQARRLPQKDAFRLLMGAQHALREVELVLGAQQEISLQRATPVQIEDLRQLNSDLLGQLETVTEQVMKLFGYSGDPAAVLVPQH